jgi:aspartyl-tRNA synthetase
MRDLRADRQPEFTQIDCEMAFIEQEDILNVFEGLIRTLFKNVKGIDLAEVPRMQYADAMRLYGSDKPDTRFDMKFVELKNTNLPASEAPLLWRGGGEAIFPVFDQAELIIGIKSKSLCRVYQKAA